MRRRLRDFWCSAAVTRAQVNWRNGKELPVGTYRVKGGKVIEWDGKRWVRREDGQEVDPLANRRQG